MASACVCPPGPCHGAAAAPHQQIVQHPGTCALWPHCLKACLLVTSSAKMHWDWCTQHGCIVHACSHCLFSVEEADDGVCAPHTMSNGVWLKHVCKVHGVTGHAGARKLFRQRPRERNSGAYQLLSYFSDECPGVGVRGLREAASTRSASRRTAGGWRSSRPAAASASRAFALAPPTNESRGADLLAWPAEMPQARLPACQALCLPSTFVTCVAARTCARRTCGGPRACQAAKMPQAQQLQCCALALHLVCHTCSRHGVTLGLPTSEMRSFCRQRCLGLAAWLLGRAAPTFCLARALIPDIQRAHEP